MAAGTTGASAARVSEAEAQRALPFWKRAAVAVELLLSAEAWPRAKGQRVRFALPSGRPDALPTLRPKERLSGSQTAKNLMEVME